VSEQPQGRRFKLPPAAIAGIILFVLCGIALFIRIYFPYDQVFSGGSVWFTDDAWYHMRLVENMIQHFPHRIYFDAYTYYPHGTAVPWPPFYDWLIAGAAWIIGLGHPSQHLVETVGAFTPAILGTLTVIPVYFIGKELFNRWAGVISAAILVVLPSEFLSRSLLGFTDHHAAETLFSTVIILFLIMAVKRAREREISFSHLVNKDWAVIKKPLIYTLLAGVFLGIYLLTWIGGLMLVFIIFAYLGIQFIVDHLRGKSTDYLCIIGVLTFAIASIMSIHFVLKTWGGTISLVSVIIAILAPLGLSGLSRFMAGKAFFKPAYYPLALLGIAGVGLLIFWLIAPSLFHSMLGLFSVFTPHAGVLTIQEARPLDVQMAWSDFTTSFFIAFIGLGLLIYRAVKERSADKTLFLVWCVVMLVATFGQRRFCYYFAVNAALLTGYFSWRVLDFAGLKKLLTKPKELVSAYTTKKKKKKTKAREKVSQRRFLQPRATWIKVVGAGIAIFFLVLFPNIDPNDVATHVFFPSLYQKNLPALGRMEVAASMGPVRIDPDWYSALVWLRGNTTEPFDDPDYYYQLYEAPPSGEDYDYPYTAYGIMSWWDYGHWITRVGRRIPIANPFQEGATIAGKYLTSQNETSANQIMDELGAEYVMIDYPMPVLKFYAMVTWAGENESDFYDVYYAPTGNGTLQPVRLFYPSYYNSTVVRLYNFNGEAVVPAENATIVISYRDQVDRQGMWYKEITGSWSFSTYEEAGDFISSNASENYKIVAVDPFKSPVPLEKLEHYQLVYATSSPYPVKIFKYTK